MPQIACWYDVTDENRLAEYVRKLGIRHVMCDARHVGSGPGGQRISTARVRKLQKALGQNGIQLGGVTVGWVRADTLDAKGGRQDRQRILQNLQALGAAGVGVAQLFVMIKAAPDEATRAAHWKAMIAYLKQVAATAKRAKVRVGLHGSQDRDHLVTDLEAYRRVFREVGSDALGATLCLGCLAIQGSDPVKALRRLGDRLVIVHARDLVLHEDGSWTDVNLGEGQIDYPAVKRTLERLKYDGPIQPEHLGSFSFENREEITMATAIGFLRGLLEPRQPAAQPAPAAKGKRAAAKRAR